MRNLSCIPFVASDMSLAINKRWAFWRTIGARLTLWGAAITLLACVLMCGILYFGLRHSLISEVDGFLEGEVSEFRSILTEEKEGTDFPNVEREIRRELGSRLSDCSSRIHIAGPSWIGTRCLSRCKEQSSRAVPRSLLRPFRLAIA